MTQPVSIPHSIPKSVRTAAPKQLSLSKVKLDPLLKAIATSLVQHVREPTAPCSQGSKRWSSVQPTQSIAESGKRVRLTSKATS
jgi:hypothetical protein